MYVYIDTMEPCFFEGWESSLGSAIEEANQVLDARASGNGITADELESAANDLQKTVKSVVSDGLAESHPRVVKATELHKSLCDMATEMTVSALHVVSSLSVCVSSPVNS